MLTIAQVILVALMALAYGARTLGLRAAGGQPPLWRAVCFAAGACMIVVAVLALGGPSSELLYNHVIEMVVIADLGAILIAIGVTRPILAPLGRLPLAGALRWLTAPAVALVVWMADFAFWHWNWVFEAAMRRGWLQLVEHVALTAAALNMWIALFGATESSERLSTRGRVAYILAGRSFGALVGAAAIWVPTVYYPIYSRSDAAGSLSPLADQGIAGAILLGEMAAVAIALLVWMHVALRTPKRAEPSTRAHTPEGAELEPGQVR